MKSIKKSGKYSEHLQVSSSLAKGDARGILILNKFNQPLSESSMKPCKPFFRAFSYIVLNAIIK